MDSPQNKKNALYVINANDTESLLILISTLNYNQMGLQPFSYVLSITRILMFTSFQVSK